MPRIQPTGTLASCYETSYSYEALLIMLFVLWWFYWFHLSIMNSLTSGELKPKYFSQLRRLYGCFLDFFQGLAVDSFKYLLLEDALLRTGYGLLYIKGPFLQWLLSLLHLLMALWICFLSLLASS
ncbi:hypothetical protein TNCT_513711 [Trichonephila clavata]|uniref:Uncharacterized protein n=1 Tax=Trichonephila clavata TaxID=2740835 RepID=A0A8X6GV08_TRICU|nr:hypothetical protein TNCT_513711 [Trichonephila clavata]